MSLQELIFKNWPSLGTILGLLLFGIWTAMIAHDSGIYLDQLYGATAKVEADPMQFTKIQPLTGRKHIPAVMVRYDVDNTIIRTVISLNDANQEDMIKKAIANNTKIDIEYAISQPTIARIPGMSFAKYGWERTLRSMIPGVLFLLFGCFLSYRAKRAS